MIWTGVEIRGPRLISEAAHDRLIAVRVGDPLLLVREPANPADPSAVLVLNFAAEPMGYLQWQVAAEVAPHMDRGLVPVARVTDEPRTTGVFAVVRGQTCEVVTAPTCFVQIDERGEESEYEWTAFPPHHEKSTPRIKEKTS